MIAGSFLQSMRVCSLHHTDPLRMECRVASSNYELSFSILQLIYDEPVQTVFTPLTVFWFYEKTVSLFLGQHTFLFFNLRPSLASPLYSYSPEECDLIVYGDGIRSRWNSGPLDGACWTDF